RAATPSPRGQSANRVDGAALRLRALVGGRRELALGQPVHAVILDDVDHVDAAADAMRELAEPDRGAVAVTRHAEIDQVGVGDVGHQGSALRSGARVTTESMSAIALTMNRAVMGVPS